LKNENEDFKKEFITIKVTRIFILNIFRISTKN